jgi:hypothetical protein
MAVSRWSNATWVTLTYIILGVVIAVASGFDATIKPGQLNLQGSAFRTC